MLYAVLLQEMQLETASKVDSRQAGDLIPAVWGKSTPEARQISEPIDYLTQETAMSQVRQIWPICVLHLTASCTSPDICASQSLACLRKVWLLESLTTLHAGCIGFSRLNMVECKKSCRPSRQSDGGKCGACKYSTWQPHLHR